MLTSTKTKTKLTVTLLKKKEGPRNILARAFSVASVITSIAVRGFPSLSAAPTTIGDRALEGEVAPTETENGAAHSASWKKALREREKFLFECESGTGKNLACLQIALHTRVVQ